MGHSLGRRLDCSLDRIVSRSLMAIATSWMAGAGGLVPSVAHAQSTPSPVTSTSTQSPDESSGLYIKVTGAQISKSMMAIPPFQFSGTPGSSASAVRAGKDLYDIFRNNMEKSGYFTFVSPSKFPEDTNKSSLKPASSSETGGFSFEGWKLAKTDFLVRVGYRTSGDQLTVDTYAYYVPQSKLVMGKSYTANIKDVRSVAHTFGNDLIKALTGNKGWFNSKIVVSRSTKKDQKEIYVMDWDGANARAVTSHKSIAQSPTWSFDGKTIAYTAFVYHPKEKTRNWDVFTYELDTGRRFLVSYQKGINSGAAFMPDNKHLLLTISTDAGATNIFKMTLDGLSSVPITKGRGTEMNVEPAISPDGKKIAFSSNRSGKPMIFSMNADGSAPDRLTIAGDFNATPAWSPDGKKIAFAGQESGNFDLFIMDADGTNMRRLTQVTKKPSGRASHNEDPSFTPDGRHILFRSNRTGRYQLYMVSIDGEDEHRLTFDQYDYYKPRWSPSLD